MNIFCESIWYRKLWNRFFSYINLYYWYTAGTIWTDFLITLESRYFVPNLSHYIFKRVHRLTFNFSIWDWPYLAVCWIGQLGKIYHFCVVIVGGRLDYPTGVINGVNNTYIRMIRAWSTWSYLPMVTLCGIYCAIHSSCIRSIKWSPMYHYSKTYYMYTLYLYLIPLTILSI